MTRRTDIIDAVAAALNPISGITVYKWREDPTARGEGTVVVVRRAIDNPIARRNLQAERDFTFAIDVITRGAAPDVDADVVLEQIVPVIWNDADVRALCVQLTEGATQWQTGSADQDACVATMAVVAKYRSVTQSLT